MAITRPFPGALNLSTPARRTAAVVAGATAVFWLAAFVLTCVTTQLRYDALTAAAPRMQAAIDRVDLLTHSRPGTLWFGSVGTSASDQLGAIVGHVTTVSLAFAAIAALMAVLVLHRHTGYAIVAAVAGTAGVALGGGPLSLIVGTIHVDAVSFYGLQPAAPGATEAQRAFVEYQNTSVAFATPTWWSLVVAAGVALVLAATVLALRVLPGTAAAGADTGAARIPGLVAPLVAIVAVVVSALVGMNDLTTTDETYSSRTLAAMLLTYGGLTVAAAVAGACLASGRRSIGPALALTGLVAVAAFFMWSTHHVSGGADHVFGWVDLGSDPPLIETPLLAAGLLLAVPFGWVSGTIATRVARRASGAGLIDAAPASALR